MKRGIEVVGLGACVYDTLISVGSFPVEDEKMRAISSGSAGGGPAATAVVASAKLGISAGFVGVLSDEMSGDFLCADFERYGVDISGIERKRGTSFSSWVLLNTKSGSRTCVADRGTLLPLVLSDSQRKIISSAKILELDGNELDAACEAAAIARANGAKVLYDAGSKYPNVERLVPYADYLIPSEGFAADYTGEGSAEGAAIKLYEEYHPELVIITQGKKGGICFDGREMFEYPSFKVEAVDTNGAGDCFHGAFAAAMLYGLTPREACVFSSVVSAIKCTKIGARASTPDLNTTIEFLRRYGYEFQEKLG